MSGTEIDPAVWEQAFQRRLYDAIYSLRMARLWYAPPALHGTLDSYIRRLQQIATEERSRNDLADEESTTQKYSEKGDG